MFAQFFLRLCLFFVLSFRLLKAEKFFGCFFFLLVSLTRCPLTLGVENLSGKKREKSSKKKRYCHGLKAGLQKIQNKSEKLMSRPQLRM